MTKTATFAAGPRALARLLIIMLRGYWRYVWALFALVLFTAIMEGIGFSLLIPLLQTVLSPASDLASSNFLQRAIGQVGLIFPPEWRLIGLLGLLGGIFLIKSLGLIAATGFTRWFINTLRISWSAEVFLGYLHAPYASVAARPHGEIVQNIIGETDTASRAVLLLIEFTARFIQVTVLVTLLLFASWQATLFVLMLGAIGFWLSWKPSHRFSLRVGGTRQNLKQQLTDIVSETITGLRTLKLLDAARPRAKRLRQMLRSYRKVDTGFETVSALPSNMIDLIAIFVGTSVIAFMTLWLKLSIEEVLPITALFGVVFLRLAAASSHLFSKQLNITNSLVSLRTVHDMMTAQSEQVSGSRPFPGIQGNLVLDDIALQPPGRPKLFDGLRMTIPPVGLTAIVGPSGSGKTTLVDLIVRLREPDAGRVLINGRDVREFDVRSLRARVGYLSQEPQLFNGTVAENLRLGRADATDAELVAAATRAHAHEFVTAMAQGYDTPLGRGAVTLSGGQRQRLALAREILRNPDLYIFDEPTSALDAEAEAVIGELVNELSRTHPIIIISHRPDVIFGAHVIYRIEQGQAVELRLPELVKVSAAGAAP